MKRKVKKVNIFFAAFCRIYQFAFRLVAYILPWRKPALLTGEGCVTELPALISSKKLKRPLIVTDPVLFRLGLASPLIAGLEKRGIENVIFKDVKQNPAIENVEAAAAAYREGGCDCIIAFGGGSAIDCAKAAGARIVRPRRSVRKMAGVLRVSRKLPPFFAVPTTAGTGSEATLAAVITDAATRRKFAINDPSLIPHYAVLDPKLTEGLPPALTAATGMDALTHAIEAYIGRSNTKQTRSDAEKSFRLIKQNLVRAFTHGDDTQARQNMLQASFCAGRAFTRAYVGNIHAAAHTLSGFYDVPHGLANAVLLPHVLEYYGKAAHKKLGRVADIMGVSGASAAEKSANLIAYIRELNRQLGIPEGFDCIKQADLPAMVRNALKEANPLYPVPVIFCRSDFENIFSTVNLAQGE